MTDTERKIRAARPVPPIVPLAVTALRLRSAFDTLEARPSPVARAAAHQAYLQHVALLEAAGLL